MISHISIRDFAIIDKIEIDFQQGLSIITGETGSGKSIIIEAVNLALGSRADTAFIRSGKEKAVVQMIAELDGEDYIITREISSNGKNICKINDEIVTLAHLNKLCKRIADVHGQYDHQSLLNPENHIKLLDSYHGEIISPMKGNVSELYAKYTRVKEELSSLVNHEAETERKRDFMKYELQEIISAKPYPGEDDDLTQKLNLLQNSEKIYRNLSEIYEISYEASPSALENLGISMHLLQEIECFSDDMKEYSNTLSDLYYRLEDVTSEIRKYRDSISFSPDLLEETMNRLDLLEGLKRKYGGSIEKVLLYEEKLTEELSRIENIDQLLEDLRQELALIEQDLLAASTNLSATRKKAAKKIEACVNEELKELNFKNAELLIYFEPRDPNRPLVFSENGIDKIEFLIATNKGEHPKPLAKVASGGEVSRIMLAFKRIIGDYDAIPTMIFDEIDTGISGITASIVGKKLHHISKNHQIICITHLPQIAAFGDHHYKIDKETVDNITCTTVVPLSQEDKVREIARLLGGINITDTTMKSANELIDLSKKGQT